MQNQISWQIYEHEDKERSIDWYWAVVVIALSIAIIAFLLKNGFFAILIIIGTATLLSHTKKAARLFDIKLDQRGLTVGKDRFPFINLESFWVDVTDEQRPLIIFKSKKPIMPLLIVPLDDYHHLDVRDFLLQYLEEKEMHEPLSHKIMDKLGF